jgi:hypothetical protein
MVAHLSIDEKFLKDPFRSLEFTEFREQVWFPCDTETFEEGSFDTAISKDYIRSLSFGGMDVCEKLTGTRPIPKQSATLIGMEVGDDRIDISDCPFALALAIYCQERVLRFETSWKDTGISKDKWNFCEVTSIVPTSLQGGITTAKKSTFDNIQFIDTPPLRIIIDVQKGDRSHSSSANGKAQMLGSRTKNARTNCKPVLEAANWFQDSLLNTCKSSDPKYLPAVLGGSGCPPLWGDWRNTYLYLKAFRGGTYQRIYGSAINELRHCVDRLDSNRVTQPAICSHLRRKQDYLHATYASNVFVPRQAIKEGLDANDVRPLYRAVGGNALLQGVENRLIQAGKILTRSKAEAEITIRDGVNYTLFGYQRVTVVRENQRIANSLARRAYDGALSANAALQRLLLRNANESDFLKLTRDENFIVAGFGQTELTKVDAEWISLGGKGEAFTIEDLTFSEDMYSYDEVSLTKSLRVGGIPLTPRFANSIVQTRRTVPAVGLWQITEEKSDWADRIHRELLRLRDDVSNPSYQDVFPIYYENREWVADDSLLVRRATDIASSLTKATLLLVSSDKRLGRRMARTTGMHVARVEPAMVILNNPSKVWCSQTSITVGEALGTNIEHNNVLVGFPPVYHEVFIDTGSLEATALQLASDPSLVKQNRIPLFVSTLVDTGINRENLRYQRVQRITFPGRLVVRVMMHLASGPDRFASVLREEEGKPVAGNRDSRLSSSMKRFLRM